MISECRACFIEHGRLKAPFCPPHTCGKSVGSKINPKNFTVEIGGEIKGFDIQELVYIRQLINIDIMTGNRTVDELYDKVGRMILLKDNKMRMLKEKS